MNSSATAPRYALLSVYDKSGITEFAQHLVSHGYSLLSTGGTAKLLRQQGLAVTEVSEYTGFPEIMGGRVKTLHPRIHGGILGRRGVDDEVMRQHAIASIDVVAVNLYPFEKTVSAPDCTIAEAIENIDIGGPVMLRAAAKNHASVTVVTDPDDYPRVVTALRSEQAVPSSIRIELAAKAYAHTARYDGIIADYLGARSMASGVKEYPPTLHRQWIKRFDLRYGENPHQRAAFYRDSDPDVANDTVSSAEQIQGRELSYNNIADSDAALECVRQFERPACVIVKHANPCGAAEADTVLQAYEAAYATDPTSAFGGIIAFNRVLDNITAQTIIERQFVEVIIAPALTDAACAAIAKRDSVRVLVCGALSKSVPGLHYERVTGGLLVQNRDVLLIADDGLATVTRIEPDEQVLRDLLFAWKVAKFVKSNAIVFARDLHTIGVGAGQMSRVYSSRIAAIKAMDENLEVSGAVMASDAFFPFRDGIDTAANAGIRAVIQPGGSRNDDEVIAAANEHGMAMVFTGMRHFRH